MRLFIPGGAGCLGSNLIERYIPDGVEICVLDNFATSSKVVLPTNLTSLRVIEGDVADSALVDKIFTDFRPSHIIHAAAAYKDPDDWSSDVNTNVLGTINLVSAAEKHGVQRFINLQTALCYGRPEQVPIPVEHPNAPLASYGISKVAGEDYLAVSGLPYLSLRLANICAPRLAIGPIPTFYTRLKEGKKCFCTDSVRDFLDIRDFLALMDIILAGGEQRGKYNVSSGVGYSIKDVFDAVVEYLGVKLDWQPEIIPVGNDDVALVVLDASKTTADFNWRPATGFKETIFNMLRWYDQHGVSAIFSHVRPPAQQEGAA